MECNKRGISLIVLVITIVVVIILAGAIIFGITQSGVLDTAKKAKFMNDFRGVEEGVGIYSMSNINISNPSEFLLPTEGKLDLSDKQNIADNVLTLQAKIEELNPGKTLDDINLYWIDEPAIGANNIPSNKADKGYIIDIASRQIYDYYGDFFENKRWHTLDGGVTEVASEPGTQEMWNGWMKLTLYYPPNSTEKMWRLGNEGEVRVDPMLMWQNYTGPITIPLDRVKDVWIKYKLDNKEVIIPPAGTLLVDIVPDSTGTQKVQKVNVKINYDSEATTKEYKVGGSNWMTYTGAFDVTENCVIQARAKKTENIYNTDGSLLMTRDIAGSDIVYIGNIGVDENIDYDLPSPQITRLAAQDPDEKARVEITYPSEAVRKIYKINYGVEQNYSNELSIKSWGTYIIAYYYDANGKKSRSVSILINDTTTGNPPEDEKPHEPLPPYDPEVPPPYEPKDPKKILPPPIITRQDPVGTEKARVKITYPANAVNKIYTMNYGTVQNYTSELLVNEWGTFIMAYYYDAEGNKSQIAWIRITETPTDPGTYEPDPIEVIEAPVIKINPDTGIASEVSVSVVSPANASKAYIKIGKYGTYQEYTGPITVRDNIEIYAYYVTNEGGKSLEARARVTNILKNDMGINPKPYLIINAYPYPWTGAPGVAEVTVSITSNNADKVEYSEDGIIFKPYTASFKVTENKRIYARATNANGVTEAYLDITNIGGLKEPEAMQDLAISINVYPEPALSSSRVPSARVTIEYDKKATEKYYSIGKYGELKTYTGSFDVTSNCTIYAYAKGINAQGEASKTIDNILSGISDPVIVASPGNGIQASKVGISINYDRYATIKKYSVDGGALNNYTTPFEVTKNGTVIYAYSENAQGQKSEARYTVENIIPPPPVVTINKGNYYLLKLTYPEGSKGREYKWKVDGEWKPYKEAGILLIKPQFKDEVIKNGSLVKIEDENGKIITFTGDYYLIDVPISQLFENISMRWDRVAPAAPQIIVDPTDPAKKVTATIMYDPSMVKKQYRILTPGDTLGEWKNYVGPMTIDRNNTEIYAKQMDDSEVWSQEAMVKVTNIDEVAPVIKLTADLITAKQSVGVKVDVTDDVAVGLVKWAPGIQGESYFANNGTMITNNSTVTINENGYYTFYAEDKVGNMQVYTLNVENIDNLPPTNPVISADPITWTKSNVTVTITYPEDITVKEYSTNGTSWIAYTAPIVVSSNATIYARCKDAAGNQSGQSTLTIANIDKTAPTVGFGTNGANNVEVASTSVIVSDGEGSGINASTLQYVWSTQNANAPASGWATFTNSSNITQSGEEGTYYLWVKATDNVGNTVTTKTNAFVIAIQVVVNKPMLAPGMTAIKWNQSTNTWDSVSDPENDSTWYNYTNKEWANAKTADGSMWVWIPRFIYKISSGWHSSTTGVVNVQFSKGIDDNWNSAVIGNINTSNLATASNNSWTNHPAFTFGTQELTGLWVAKFSATGSATALTSKPGLSAFSSQFDAAFQYVRNMEKNSMYGWSTTGERVDTHLVKNTEWGAIAYLAKSSYGRNATEITINATNYTGGGSTATAYVSNTAQSTTGNVYGVYDMSSFLFTFTAAYINDNSQNYLGYGSNMINAPAKYKDMYTTTDVYSSTSRKGDAFYEISSNSGTTGWFNDYFISPYNYGPFVTRGGRYSNGITYDGIFNMYYQTNSNLNLRPILVVGPKEPKISVNPTTSAPEVDAIIDYESSTVVRKYRTLEPGGTLGQWQDYTGPILITKYGTTVYAKAQDGYGLWSGESSYIVNNVSPTNPVITASPTTLTSGNVTVTITFSADATTKQYSYDGTTWSTYSSPLTITTNNTTVYAKGRNSGGVYSGQSTLTITNIEEGVANAPVLAPGMTALKWNSSTSSWDPVSDPDNDTTWYNYRNKEWANAKTADGSMWVWIPRYVYKISSGWHQQTSSGVINIQFSQGTNDLWNSNRTVNTGIAVTTSNNAWTTHPAFTFGTVQLTGIWVAKYTYTGAVATPDFKPGVQMPNTSIGIDIVFTACRNMETNSRYGWGTSGTGFDTHLIKNSEWGAVAYLSNSSYGKDRVEITKNNSNITGGGTIIGNGAQSTTGNVNGVYDMSMAYWQYVAAYRSDGSLNWGTPLVNAAAQYKDVYTASTIYSTTSPKGDATYEVSSYNGGSYAWFNNILRGPDTNNAFVLRGGEYYDQLTPKTAGIYSGYSTYGSSSATGFRATIAVNSGL